MKKRRNRNRNIIPILLMILSLSLLAGLVFVILGTGKKESGDERVQIKIEEIDAQPDEMTTQSEENVTQPEVTDNQPDENGTDSAEQPYTMDEFYVSEISDEIFARIYGKSYKEDCFVPREDLRYLHLLYKDANGNTQTGEMIVNAYIASDVLEIFKTLYEADYPFERIELVDEYEADDDLSILNNNTSAFNFRCIGSSNKISKHGLGLAIDINPFYNPYVKKVNGVMQADPEAATEYMDRSRDFIYKIDENDLLYRLFTQKGFIWGGSWKNIKDYQHFEVSNETAKELYPQWQN